MRPLIHCLVIGACSLLLLPVAQATEGHQLIGIGAVQKGTGGAGVASAKDATWTMLNPAGVVRLKRRLDVGLEVFAPRRGLKPQGPLLLPMANSRAGRMTDNSIFYIPTVSAVIPRKNYTLGIGLFGVNGLGVDYRAPRASLGRLFGRNYDRRTEYAVAKLAIAGAHSFDNGWALGSAIHLNYARFKSDMLTLGFRQTEGDNAWDDSIGIGFSLGIQKKWERLSVGAAYTSRQWMGHLQDYSDLLGLPLDLPQIAQVGIAYDITPTLEFVADYKFMDWSGINQIGNEPLAGGFGWKDQHIVKSGLTWQTNERWTLRSGVSFGNSPIDEEHVFANGLFPAIMTSHASAGFSVVLTPKTTAHFTYMHAFRNELTDSGKGDLFSLADKGTEIWMSQNSFTFGVSYAF
ncbi:MAG: outer membrane protein transport protein [Candidatus Hydrogenedentes bacterium]|nr:outer membrane protein transport protein [Candidatus Hydrogenedentota bacterium]